MTLVDALTATVAPVYYIVQLLRDLPDATRCPIEPVIVQNPPWAHSEHVLLAMAAENDRSRCEEAVKLIRGFRERQQAKKEAAA